MRRSNVVDDQSTDGQDVAPAATDEPTSTEITPPETAPDPEPTPEPEGAAVDDSTAPEEVTGPEEEVTNPTVALRIVSGADRFAYYHGEETRPRFVSVDSSDVDEDDVEAVLTSAASVGIQIVRVKAIDEEVGA